MGEEITEIKFPEEDELTAGMLKAMDRAEGSVAGQIELLSDLINIPVSDIDEKMSWPDYMACSKKLQEYLGNSESGGGKTQ